MEPVAAVSATENLSMTPNISVVECVNLDTSDRCVTQNDKSGGGVLLIEFYKLTDKWRQCPRMNENKKDLSRSGSSSRLTGYYTIYYLWESFMSQVWECRMESHDSLWDKIKLKSLVDVECWLWMWKNIFYTTFVKWTKRKACVRVSEFKLRQ